MADPVAVAFEALLVSIVAVFLLAYASFARMNPDIRRARLFIMAGRIHRFLLAYTFGFLALVLFMLAGLLGVVLNRSVAAGVVFLSFGALLYGSLEILLVAHPIRAPLPAMPPREGVGSSRGRP